jgi:alpha-ribazole phosphatase
MIINLIRHGKTQGNAEKRYIGRTDEPLSDIGISELKKITYPPCDVLAVSPMKRCIMTAEIIYPHMDKIVCPELTEIDFGSFEGRNYIELSGNEDYQKWIDSGGTIPFPDGEDLTRFKKRSIDGFTRLYSELPKNCELSLIVHGGTIMSLMEHFLFSTSSYYDNQCGNGHGYIVDFDGKHMRRTGNI